jgi:hypothetical protein
MLIVVLCTKVTKVSKEDVTLRTNCDLCGRRQHHAVTVTIRPTVLAFISSPSRLFTGDNR